MYKKLTFIIILSSVLIACSQNFYNKKLMKAIKNNDTYKVSSILEKQKANINYISESEDEYIGITPLTFASRKGNYEIVKLLVDKGAGVNIKNVEGRTALIEASIEINILRSIFEMEVDETIKYGNLEVVKYLVENGADINAKDNNGETALMKAAKNRNLEIVKYLVESGANVNAQNEDGKTAFDLMVIKGNEQMETNLITALGGTYYSGYVGGLGFYLNEEEKEKVKEEMEEIGKVLKGIR